MRTVHKTKIISLLMVLALVNLLLLAPRWLLTDGQANVWLALEAPLVVWGFALIPRRRWGTTLAVGAAIVLVCLSALTFADTILRESLARPLNLYLDVHLLGSVVRLLNGTFGPIVTELVIVGSFVGAAALAWILARLLCRIGRESQKAAPGGIHITALACFGLLVGLYATADTLSLFSQRATLPAITLIKDQTEHFRRMLNERKVFAAELASVPTSHADVPNLLHRLEGRDVVLGFIESYGMSALNDPRYAPVVRPRLDELGRRMQDAGLSLATGTMVAPTQGGQSWFSHGSLLSGAWLDNQLRYDLLLASGRETLIDDFRRAGYRTVALMPAITMAWPEGDRLGYDQILAHEDIEYAGPPLNWVTMPDQFTWSYLEHTVREPQRDDPRPLFAEIGLISSHAPWTPILPVLDEWDAIDDGAIFAPWEHAGERPVDLWRDIDRVREHFALSVDYAIAAMIGYAERYLDDQTLLIVLGDHQPAPMITGDEASRAVPVHIISGHPGLVRPFAELGFKTGAFPDPNQTPHRMDTFRDWFVQAFSRP
jgi:hypothetical protein